MDPGSGNTIWSRGLLSVGTRYSIYDMLWKNICKDKRGTKRPTGRSFILVVLGGHSFIRGVLVAYLVLLLVGHKGKARNGLN